MKKNIEKIFTSCNIVVAVILIMILIITAFDGIKPEDFDNELVQGLLITLAILYLLLAITSLVLIFIKNDILKEITIRSGQSGSVKVSAGVVTKLVKSACNQVEGVKCKKVVLISDDYGVRLKVDVKITDRDVVEAETYLRTLIGDAFDAQFGFTFNSIEIKVMALQSKYQADQDKINELVEKKLAELKKAEAKIDNDEVAVATDIVADDKDDEAVADEVAEQENADDVEETAEVKDEEQIVDEQTQLAQNDDDIVENKENIEE